VNESTPIIEESIANVGATVMGRNMFGGGPGPWNADTPWNGWWGDNPPYHHPVFVLTHHERLPLALEGATTFHFVTQGPEAALDAARRAAGASDVMVAGGAKTAQQYLAKGAVDEMDISLVPILLGAGERLFEGLGADLHELKLVRTIAAADVTHLKYVR
jgi:dihydrofolate reductase